MAQTIFLLMLQDFNMARPEVQEYYTTEKKAVKRLDEIAGYMDSAIFNINRVSRTELQGIRKDGNKAPRRFFIESANVL